MVAHMASATGLYILASDHAPTWYRGWIGAVLAITLARTVIAIGLGRRLREPDPSASRSLASWRLAHCLGLIASAGQWALVSWIRLPIETLQIQYGVMIVLSGLAGGAMGVLAPLRWTGRVYVSLILLPACLRLLLVPGTAPVLLLSALLGLAFWAVMIVGHRNNTQALIHSLNLAEENLALVAALQSRNEDIASINQSLEQRVVERTQALEAMAVKAEAANLAKSAFLATISHEIRTPLNGVLGMVQVMRRTELGPDQRGHLEVIQSSADALLGIVSDVLDISKIEAGRMELHPAPFDLQAFDLQAFGLGLQRLYELLAHEKGLAFTLTVSNALPGARLGDEARLRQIVANLISNALKFTEAGSVEVSLVADDSRLTCSVTDTGAGIAPEMQEHVFERFIQADDLNARRSNGTGLGLAICRELVSLMEGQITCASVLGQGSTFTVILPLPVALAVAVTRPQAPGATVPEGPEGAALRAAGRILVVDDNPTNQLVLQTLLQDVGMVCQVCDDGVAAVAAWEAGDWDAILMDINMPRMNGVEATRAIRDIERDRARTRTPIIAVTASAMAHETEFYLSAGLDEVVAKPIDAATLVDSIRRRISMSAHA